MTVEELQKDLLFDISSTFMMAEVPKEDYQSVAAKVVALIIAVEKRTKERVLDAYIAKFNMGGSLCVIIRASVLDPTKEADHDH